MVDLPDGLWKVRWAIPIDRPPIFHAAVEIESGLIRNLGAAESIQGPRIVDLGDIAILPPLVNSHTHLEFSHLRQPLGQPAMRLADWIAETIAARQQNSAESPAEAITIGLAEIANTATSHVGEIATTPWPVDDLETTRKGLTIHPFAEVLGLTATRAQQRLDAAVFHLDRFLPAAGISPHAPYSTPPELILRCIELSRQRQCPVAMHVAESTDERDLLVNGRGPFAESLRRLGLEPERSFPWAIAEPIRWLIHQLSTAPRGLLIHGNDLTDLEIEDLSRHKNLSVVMCPRTHAYFAHGRHPIDRLLAAGVNVALGTDSRASNPDLDVWGEAQFLLRHRQDIAPEAILRMVTSAGHTALTGIRDAGTLANGQPARFGFAPTSAYTVDQLWQSLANTPVARLALPAQLAYPIGPTDKIAEIL